MCSGNPASLAALWGVCITGVPYIGILYIKHLMGGMSCSVSSVC